MAYGMAKAALEHLTCRPRTNSRPFGIAVNTFRIDVPVASEGFVFNLPDADHSDWEPSEVAAEGIVWMLEQPHSGHNVGMARCAPSTGSWRHAHGGSTQRTDEHWRRSISTDAPYIDIAERRLPSWCDACPPRHHRRQLLRVDVGGRVGAAGDVGSGTGTSADRLGPAAGPPVTVAGTWRAPDRALIAPHRTVSTKPTRPLNLRHYHLMCPVTQVRGWLQALDDHRHALAAADAHRLEAVAACRASSRPLMQRGHDAGAGHAERVAERDRAAVHVELLPSGCRGASPTGSPARRTPR